jgi:hypothetical protein
VLWHVFYLFHPSLDVNHSQYLSWSSGYQVGWDGQPILVVKHGSQVLIGISDLCSYIQHHISMFLFLGIEPTNLLIHGCITHMLLHGQSPKKGLGFRCPVCSIASCALNCALAVWARRVFRGFLRCREAWDLQDVQTLQELSFVKVWQVKRLCVVVPSICTVAEKVLKNSCGPLVLL